MGRKTEDLTRKTFGRLLALKRAEKKGKGAYWLCECSCPEHTKVIVSSSDLRRGHTKSCGCLSRETRKQKATRHGWYGTKCYTIYFGMKTRCQNPKNQKYYRYGGRGITVYPEWLDKENGFMNFYNYVSKLPHFGEKGYTLNRIDNDGNYEPGNVEWSDDVTQANNRRNNHYITFNGERKTMKQWARELRINYNTLRSRINELNWTIEKAFTTP